MHKARAKTDHVRWQQALLPPPAVRLLGLGLNNVVATSAENLFFVLYLDATHRHKPGAFNYHAQRQTSPSK